MAIPAAQHEVAAFLQRLAGAPAHETHISAVFIGADQVWKLKKAVCLSFLDFTRLEDRARLLRRELELNRPAAPFYRDVVAIVRTPDGLALADGTPDDALDYVLRMARVPDADFFEAIVAAGRLTAALLIETADAVAAYHAALPPVPGIDATAAMRAVLEGNADAAHEAGLPEHDVAAWRQAARDRLTGIAAWLGGRAATGFVRRAHGDLHLGNLCLWQGHPVPFDALEFNEAMATIDLGYDLAFLLMDLDQRVDRAAANLVLNRYVARGFDAGLVAGLPLFLSMRAMVRAHVRKTSGAEGWDAYLRAARAYLAPPSPRLVAVGGLQGSGKSTLARALAPAIGPAPGALVLRSDEIRKHLHGAAPEQTLPQSAYTPEANAAVNRTLLDLAAQALGGGHAVIADATFLDPAQRDAMAQLARRAGVNFTGLWLEAPLAVLAARIAARRDDASDATIAVLHAAAANSPGAGDWIALPATTRESALAAAQSAMTG